ncbi:MAG: hypothetical protein OXN83_03660 [Oligoflexia bacterium]|nr:hypothetical protein [Oligoflexia bacterium]
MTSFPIDAVIFNKIIEVFNQTRQYVLLLFPLAFFIRIAFGFILLKKSSFTDILKDSLFLFLGLFFFTDILKMTLQIPYFVSSELSTTDFKSINLGEGIFTKTLKRLVDWIGIITYWISFGLYVVIVSILGFFAGYILFFGTMFRVYGLLKVFFILLFTVSLWPLLWHSINFAVLTIAVSDNAFANNVIIGGASLAKVFIPIWLISKTSKLPFSQTLKKVSLTGGGLALAGSSYASSFLNNKSSSKSFKNKQETNQEITNKGAKISLSQIEEKQSFTKDEDYLNSPVEDFSFQTQPKRLQFQNSNQNELFFKEESQNNTNVSSEKSLNETKTQTNIQTNEQTINEDKDILIKNQPQDFSNESILNSAKHLDTELSNKNPESFAIKEESLSKKRDNLNRPPQKKEKNNTGDIEL